MKKKNIMPVLVLVVICIAVAAALAVVNMITAPIINDRNNAAIQESLGKAMPGGEFNSEPDALRGEPETISKIYTEKNGKGWVVVLLTNKGYESKNIGFTVGIDRAGKITGLVITENNDSIVPPMLKPGGNYGDAYVGAGSDDIYKLETGATVSFTEGAIKNAINDAMVYLGFAKPKPEIPRSEEELLARAKAFLGNDSANLKCIKVKNKEFVKRIYKERGSDTYIAYAFTYSQYGTPEFEMLVHVNADGTVRAVEKILWKVSDPKPEWYYFPPSEERVDELFDSFVSKDLDTINTVDVKTGATNTSERVRDAAAEAIKCYDIANASYAPRIVGIVVLGLSIASVIALVIIKKRRWGAR